jgi:hypothetical protein
MAELKNMTVQALRELARKALGRGHSKFKTKTELIEALQAAERRVTLVAAKAASKVKEATGRAARATEKVVESVRKGREERGQAKGKVRQKQPQTGRERKGRAAGVSEKAAKSDGAGRESPGVAETARTDARKVRTAAVRAEPEPDPESYIVARVAGEGALRGAPHAMTEGAVEDMLGGKVRRITAEPGPRPDAYQEHLGELPWSYADDVLVALPRDPRTLFLYWDHAQDTLRRAWDGLDGGRAQLWIFVREADERWTRLRTMDVALESRSYYVHELEPGRLYRAEIHVVDRHGREKLLAKPSNEVGLPPVGPSSVVEDRFMRILWNELLPQLLREVHAGGTFSEDVRMQLARLSDWSRFAGRVWGGSAGGIGGRPSSPVSSPSAGSSPSSPWSRPDGEGR